MNETYVDFKLNMVHGAKLAKGRGQKFWEQTSGGVEVLGAKFRRGKSPWGKSRGGKSPGVKKY